MALSKIDVANMLTGAVPVANGGTALTSGFVNGFNSAPMVDTWLVTSSFTGTAEPISSNLSRSLDDSAQGHAQFGSINMTESSGIFTFPQTGFYLVEFFLLIDEQGSGADGHVTAQIEATANNSTYVEIAWAYMGIGGSDITDAGHASAVFDITDTTNQKVRFAVAGQESSNRALAASDYMLTGMRFTRLGDT